MGVPSEGKINSHLAPPGVDLYREAVLPTNNNQKNKQKKCRDPLSSGDKRNLRLKTGSQDVFTAKKKWQVARKRERRLHNRQVEKFPEGNTVSIMRFDLWRTGNRQDYLRNGFFLCANLCQCTGFMIERCPISCDKTWSDLWQRARDYAFSQIWPNFWGVTCIIDESAN